DDANTTEPMILVRITGQQEGCDKAKAEIQSLLRYRESITVPRAERSALQGRGSSVMQTLRREYDVALRRAAPADADTDTDDDQWVLVGEEAQVRAAKDYLECVVGARKYVEILEVPAHLHRFVVGRGGSTVRNISDSTRCLVHIPNPRRGDNEDESSGDAQDRITVTGSQEQVAEAKRMIEEALKRAGRQVTRGAEEEDGAAEEESSAHEDDEQ
ncbi:hypothetical protein THASP1DRAFT_26770, partial [Thamnocephalis sphaerospora]